MELSFFLPMEIPFFLPMELYYQPMSDVIKGNFRRRDDGGASSKGTPAARLGVTVAVSHVAPGVVIAHELCDRTPDVTIAHDTGRHHCT